MCRRVRMNHRKLWRKALDSPNNLRFDDLVRLLHAFGFQKLRVSGSHHIFDHSEMPEQVNIQDRGGKAKPYQVRQFIKLVERYNLEMDSK